MRRAGARQRALDAGLAAVVGRQRQLPVAELGIQLLQVVERGAGGLDHAEALVLPEVLFQRVQPPGGRDELPQPGGLGERHRLGLHRAFDERQQRQLGGHAALLDLVDDVVQVHAGAPGHARDVIGLRRIPARARLGTLGFEVGHLEAAPYPAPQIAVGGHRRVGGGGDAGRGLRRRRRCRISGSSGGRLGGTGRRDGAGGCRRFGAGGRGSGNGGRHGGTVARGCGGGGGRCADGRRCGRGSGRGICGGRRAGGLGVRKRRCAAPQGGASGICGGGSRRRRDGVGVDGGGGGGGGRPGRRRRSAVHCRWSAGDRRGVRGTGRRRARRGGCRRRDRNALLRREHRAGAGCPGCVGQDRGGDASQQACAQGQASQSRV